MIENLDENHGKTINIVMLNKFPRYHNFIFIISIVSTIFLIIIDSEIISDWTIRLIVKLILGMIIFLGIWVNSSYAKFIKDNILKDNIDSINMY